MITDGPSRQSETTRESRMPVQTSPREVDQMPALAFGTGLTALGVLRSLHDSGITVYSVSPLDGLPTRSRWYRRAPLLSGGVPEPEQLCEYLTGLPFSRAVLFPCSDDWARAIANLPTFLKERFPASVPDSRVVETMTDKWLFSSFVECLDIPRPKTIRVSAIEELESLNEASFENMFLKPIDSQEFSRRNRVKAFQLEGKRHALQIMEQIQRDGGCGFPILLQEFIPGPPSHYYLVDGFVDRNRRILALIARRRLSQYPPLFGNSSRSETIPLREVQGAVESLTRMWSAMNYRGIFDAEFKYDERDKQLKILEVNARPWWFVEFAARCRMDFCRMAYQDALGLPVEARTEYDVGRRCIYLSYDLAAHWEADRGPGGILRWMRSCSSVEDIAYRWDDPWPGIHSTWSALKNYLRRGRQ
jgi:predicted ATP-grasp superfamily ATP-dependent carboligase